MLDRELELAIKAAKLAGESILEVYQNDFSVNYKKDESPVTEADVRANQIILEILKTAFPEDAFLSEEVSDDSSRFEKERCWIIDPLDGTKEFIKKNGEFSVSIGLMEKGKIVLGVIYIPVRKRSYYAVKGGGAYRMEGESKPIKLKVSHRTKPFNLLVSRSHPSKKTLALQAYLGESILSVAEMGSAIKGCLIAEGLFDVYYNFGYSMKWDTCAMECIVHEAGGIMRKLNGESIDYSEVNLQNYGFFIVNNEANIVDLKAAGIVL